MGTNRIERGLRRARHAPLVAHAALLATIMLALLPFVGWRGVLSTDEGAAITEARSLSRDGDFGVANPFPAADPTGASFAFEKSAVTTGGFAPLPKKPTYPVLLAIADRFAGTPGMIAISIAGTLAAAVLAARIGRRLDPALELTTFWLTGLASPLFVDGYLVLAHTLAAALCTAATLMTARVLGDHRIRPRLLVGVAGLIALAVLVRAEATLFGVALALAALIVGWRLENRPLVRIAPAVFVGTVLGFALDRTWANKAFGPGLPSSASRSTAAEASSFVADRARGFLITWLRPGYGEIGAAGILLVLVVVIGVMAARELRVATPNPHAVRILAGTVVVLAVARLFVPGPSPQLVPGLVIAFPAAVWAVFGLDRTIFRTDLTLLLGSTAVLFALAVVMTQYAIGGGFEWGGRYFALALPCVTPIAALGLRGLRHRADVATAKVCVAAVVIPTLVLAFLGIDAVRTNRADWNTFIGEVVAAADATDPGDGGKPVVITTEPEAPRAAWASFDDDRWLLVPDSEVPRMLARLHTVGVSELVLLTRGANLERAIEASPYEIAGTPRRATGEEWWLPTLVVHADSAGR